MDTQLQAEDLQIIQMVDALDDLIQIANLLSERLERWLLIQHLKKKSTGSPYVLNSQRRNESS